jgi:hypothetical protein
VNVQIEAFMPPLTAGRILGDVGRQDLQRDITV